MRRIAFALAVAFAIANGGMAEAQSPPVRRHAIAKIGEPLTPPDFKHFEWVNPSAPKGGLVRVSAQGTFGMGTDFVFELEYNLFCCFFADAVDETT